MKQYHDMLRHILANGEKVPNRTGVDTIATFGYQMRFDLADGFPLVTSKKTYLKAIIHELLWFIGAQTNARTLQMKGVKIWDEWAAADGALGPIYGHQWRRFMGTHKTKDGTLVKYFRETHTPSTSQPENRAGEIVFRGGRPGKSEMVELKGFDQLGWAVNRIQTNPECRRIIVSGWNPLEVPDMALPPCHTFFQFRVLKGRLHLQMYQRSADSFLGVPFNIASYALLLQMVAQLTGYPPGEFVHTFGDLHIYENHLDQVELVLSREPKPLPKMILTDRGQKEVEDFLFEDFTLCDYDPWPAIKAEVAV